MLSNRTWTPNVHCMGAVMGRSEMLKFELCWVEVQKLESMGSTLNLGVIEARLPGVFAWGFLSCILLACTFPSLFSWYNVGTVLCLI